MTEDISGTEKQVLLREEFKKWLVIFKAWYFPAHLKWICHKVIVVRINDFKNLQNSVAKVQLENNIGLNMKLEIL